MPPNPNLHQGTPPYPPGSHQPYPTGQPSMPGSVRSARVLAYVAAGVAALGTVIAGVAAGPEAAGAVVGSEFPAIGASVCAAFFGKFGPGVRVTAIVFAALMILFGLGAVGRGIPVGIVQLGLGIAIVAALSQSRSGDWFRRGR